MDEERSYVLLLCSNGESTEGKIIRIPYRDIVMGLLANQLLLQTIATVLIQGTPRIVPRLVLRDSALSLDSLAKINLVFFQLGERSAANELREADGQRGRQRNDVLVVRFDDAHEPSARAHAARLFGFFVRKSDVVRFATRFEIFDPKSGRNREGGESVQTSGRLLDVKAGRAVRVVPVHVANE